MDLRARGPVQLLHLRQRPGEGDGAEAGPDPGHAHGPGDGSDADLAGYGLRAGVRHRPRHRRVHWVAAEQPQLAWDLAMLPGLQLIERLAEVRG